MVGYLEEPDIGILFESNFYYVHRNCANWTSGNNQIVTEVVSAAIVQSSARKCAYCFHFGAGISCKVRTTLFE